MNHQFLRKTTMRKLSLLGIALIGAALFSPTVHADPFDVLNASMRSSNGYGLVAGCNLTFRNG
jgi:hypothetical protein